MNTDFSQLSEDQLVAHWFHANAELHRRGTKLWHAGDFAEILVATAIGGTRSSNNTEPGWDLHGPGPTPLRWQVKALVNRLNNDRTVVGFLKPGTYDMLAIVKFANDMRSVQAWQVPAEVVAVEERWHKERDAHRVILTKELLNDPRVLPLHLELPAAMESSST